MVPLLLVYHLSIEKYLLNDDRSLKDLAILPYSTYNKAITVKVIWHRVKLKFL